MSQGSNLELHDNKQCIPVFTEKPTTNLNGITLGLQCDSNNQTDSVKRDGLSDNHNTDIMDVSSKNIKNWTSDAQPCCEGVSSSELQTSLSIEHSEQSVPCKPEELTDSDCCEGVSSSEPQTSLSIEHSEQSLPCKPEEPTDSDCCVGVSSSELQTSLSIEHSEQSLPCKPEEPTDSDCCGSGCIPCVFDIYEQEVKIWELGCAKIRNKALFGDYHLGNEDVLSEFEYRQFCITDITEETTNTRRYRFSLPFCRNLGLKIGQHVIIRGRTLSESITRQYTPVSDITCTGYFDLLIKLYKDGKLSQIIRHWKIGDKVDIRGPFGSFDYYSGKYKNLLMLAGGTGIAPMSQVIQGILNNEDDETNVQVLYACSTYNDILMKKELDDWSRYYNFSVTYLLSQEKDGKYKYGDKIHKGKLDKSFLCETGNGRDLDKCMVLICGTRSFDDDMVKYCSEIGLVDKQIFKF